MISSLSQGSSSESLTLRQTRGGSFLRFEETRSGRSIRPTWVFLDNAGTGPCCGTRAVWRLAREEAGLPDVGKHDFRHGFASFGLASGLSLPIIGTLLGHSRPKTTQRHAHLSDRHAIEGRQERRSRRYERARRPRAMACAQASSLNPARFEFGEFRISRVYQGRHIQNSLLAKF
ncbi:MAG: tyrosine-type recombinase/integrase [Roseovarius sp.]|nr:tyrosine-type recombinase/integrase [Roseovarius sp.]